MWLGQPLPHKLSQIYLVCCKFNTQALTHVQDQFANPSLLSSLWFLSLFLSLIFLFPLIFPCLSFFQSTVIIISLSAFFISMTAFNCSTVCLYCSSLFSFNLQIKTHIIIFCSLSIFPLTHFHLALQTSSCFISSPLAALYFLHILSLEVASFFFPFLLLSI